MSNRSFIYTKNDYQQNPVEASGLSEYENEVHLYIC